MAVDFTQAPTSYIPSTNSTPSFGQSGAAVSALQTSLNTKNSGVAGYVPLKVDGLYGPQTYAAAQKASNLITTSTPAQTTYTNNMSALQKAEQGLGISTPTTPPPTTPGPSTGSTGAPGTSPATTNTSTPTDPIINGLETLKTANDTASNALITSTQNSYQNKLSSLDKQFQSYKDGLQLLGIQSGAAKATPDLLLGHIQQATNDEMDKVNALKAEEAKTIMAAKTAQANNDFKTLQDETTRLKTIQDAKATAIKNVYDAVSGQSNTAKVEAHDIYDTLQTLDDSDKEAFIQVVAQKFNIPVGTLVTSLADEKNTRDKAALATKNTQSTIKKREEPKAPSSTASTKAATDEVTIALKTGKDANGNTLGNGKGSDGYVDPGVYTKAYEKWPGTPKEFLAKFPVSGSGGLINPKDYNLIPQAIRPKTKTSSRSS